MTIRKHLGRKATLRSQLHRCMIISGCNRWFGQTQEHTIVQSSISSEAYTQVNPRNLIGFRGILLAMAALLISACEKPQSVTQELDIVSGEFAINSVGTVTATDLIRFNGDFSRYNESVRIAANYWVKNNRSDLDLVDMLAELVGEVAYQIIDEVEESLRRSNCIYTVKIDDEYFRAKMRSEFDTGQVGKDKDLIIEEALLELSDRELDALNSLPDAEYELELEELVSNSGESSGGDLTEISVASQCIVGAPIGSRVRLFFFGERIAIAPQ